MNILRTTDATLNTMMNVVDADDDMDQPSIQAGTVAAGADAGKDRVYVGVNDPGLSSAPSTAGTGRIATIVFSLDSTAAGPLSGMLSSSRGTLAMQTKTAFRFDRLSIRMAPCTRRITAGVRTQADPAQTVTTDTDVVVVRDDRGQEFYCKSFSCPD
jgi:hypothetical protein